MESATTAETQSAEAPAKEETQTASGLDAAIIGATQKAEHYEIATYGTLAAWAKSLQNQEAAQLLAETLDD